MKIGNKILLISICFLICILIVIIITFSILSIKFPSIDNTIAKRDINFLSWDAGLNIFQIRNACAAYSTMAYIYVKKNIIQNPKIIYANLKYKNADGSVFPWGITSYLKTLNLDSANYWFIFKTNEFFVSWIRNQIDKGNPVILTENNGRSLHNVTVLGYEYKNYYIYDSLSGSKIDKRIKAPMPGNVIMEESEMVQKWASAEYGFLYVRLATTE